MLAQKGHGGLYAGLTSMVTHLLSFKSSENQREGHSDNSGDDSARSGDEAPAPLARSYDDDLLALLPQLHIIDGTRLHIFLSVLRYGINCDFFFILKFRFNRLLLRVL